MHDSLNLSFKKVRPSFRGIEELDAQWYGKYKCMTPERALIQYLKDTNWKLEYSDDIYREIKAWKVSKDKLLLLARKHTSRQTQLLKSFWRNERYNPKHPESFMIW